MSERDGAEGAPAAPDGKSEAQIFLEAEFARCRQALVSWDSGVAAMQEGHGKFDAAWSETVRNAGRLFGRTPTRQALEKMGRPEDASFLY